MIRKGIALTVVLLFFGMTISPSSGIIIEQVSESTSSGKTLYVGGSGPGNYTSIQDAIDNSSDGDTVFVYNGIYYEYKIGIEHSINLTGENKYNTIINGCGAIDVLRVFVDGVNISGFTITNADIEWEGVYISANYSTITNNIITNNGIGITINYSSSHSNIITGNIISNNYDYGILISYSSNNIIYHNDFINNTFMNACDMGSNTWDDGYPSGGNFWDDYTGNDSDGDGVGDTPYPIPCGNSEDRYPLMEPYFNDTSPPVTTHSLNPPEPDGDNGWYVSDVEVTLNATDNESGVKEIRYREDGSSWEIVPGDNWIFVIGLYDGNDILIEYYAIDNVGNEEDIKSFSIDMDQTVPNIDYVKGLVFWKDGTYYIRCTCWGEDETSGMDRVEMYIEDWHFETINESGPIYNFTFEYFEGFRWHDLYFYYYDIAGNCIYDYFGPRPNINDTKVSLFGLIFNPVISEQNVTFFALLVREKDIDYDSWAIRILFLKRVTYPNNYQGKIGKYFINADFWYIPDD